MFGTVASDPTVSRLITSLAADAPKALAAIGSARPPHVPRRGRLLDRPRRVMGSMPITR
ncbi:hypothetical protein I546_0205 [Mycobacterium kansasii 732]|nr:hypothetical protein I546_0205 [Mycobacterium kansasii 732]